MKIRKYLLFVCMCMALYIKAPSGTVSFNKLQSFVYKRLAFLYYIHGHSAEDVMKIIISENLARDSECLIEGTAKDKISHFTLRLLSVSIPLLEDFFIQNEIKLLCYRLQFCDNTKVLQMLQKASKQSEDIISNQNYVIKSYRKVLKSLIFIVQELETAMKRNRNFIKVPFTVGLKFVKERSYPLHFGYIMLPVTDVKSLLICLFDELLKEGLNQLRESQCVNELNSPLMQYLRQKIQTWIFSKLYSVRAFSKKQVKVDNFMDIYRKFPLCMKNLHSLLMKKHRLKHISRIQYTLFLKEIGVPSTAVVQLFKKEYSVPLSENCQTSHPQCSHNWTENEGRYLYSIEHLYGMRGSRKNYKAHSCQTLQQSYDSEGGCPFVSFDDQHLQLTLKEENLEVKDIEEIVSAAHKNKYNEACCFYLQSKINMYQKDVQKHQNSCKEIKSTKNTDEDSKPESASNSFIDNRNGVPLLISSMNIHNPSDFYSVLSSCFED